MAPRGQNHEGFANFFEIYFSLFYYFCELALFENNDNLKKSQLVPE